jgi:transposase-like protein
MKGKKRKQLSLEEKQKILQKVGRGVKKCETAIKYGISSSTLFP